jgi:hypothetical protein
MAFLLCKDANDVLYGAEYQTGSSAKPSGLDNLNQKDVPCAVCRRAGMSTILMIPGTRFQFHFILNI